MLRWLSKNPPSPEQLPEPDAAAGSVAPPADPALRSQERRQRRETLYGVVRSSMAQAGLMASSYKFKVLSLDGSGHKQMVMVDLLPGSTGDPARLAEIERTIVGTARGRHGLQVTAVYWRLNAYLADEPAVADSTLQSGQFAESQLDTSPMSLGRSQFGKFE